MGIPKVETNELNGHGSSGSYGSPSPKPRIPMQIYPQLPLLLWKFLWLEVNIKGSENQVKQVSWLAHLDD